MKLKHLFAAAFAVMALAACQEKEPELGAAGIVADKTSVEMESGISSASLSVTATRDWTASVTYSNSQDEKWLSVTPSSGKASNDAQTVEITALANDGYERSATVKFSIGLADAVVTVTQKGSKVKSYKTLADVRAYCNANGVNATTTISLPDDYLVKVWFISNQAVLDNLSSNKSSYVQDETDGLNIFFAANNTFEFGDLVEIDLSNASMMLYGGALEATGLPLESVTKIGTTTPQPLTVSMEDYLANKYESRYVTIDTPVQVKSSTAQTWYSGTASAANIDFTDAKGNGFQVRSSKYSTFGADNVPTGSGRISGIAGSFNGSAQLIFAQTSDFAGLTGARFTVEGKDYSNAESLTVAEFISRADNNTYYKLSGTVSNFYSTYCSFDLTDETGTIYVYSVDNKDDWSSTIKDGGTVVLAGLYEYYETKSQHEVVHAQIISFEEGAPSEQQTYEGVVVALSTRTFLIKTADGYKYAYDKEMTPPVQLGDKVRLTGDLSMYGKLEEVINYSVEVISSGNEVSHPEIKNLTGAEMDSYETIFGYVGFTGTLAISGSYYNITVDGSTKTGSLASPVNVDASLNGKVVDCQGYFIGLTGSDKYFNIILTSIKASDDQSGSNPGEGGGSTGGDEGGSTTSDLVKPGENEVLHVLTNAEISAVTKDDGATSTVYGNHEIASEGGTWTGNFATSQSNTFIQFRNSKASYLTSPEYSSKVTRVVLETAEEKYNATSASNRAIYAVPVVNPSELPAENYTTDVYGTNYGSTTFKTNGGAQFGEIKFNADTKQFSLISANGAVYIEAIYVFCEK
ncbi:MAG: DUF5689 domain-containing protein [Candidatus Cryptobacteroides sp.]